MTYMEKKNKQRKQSVQKKRIKVLGVRVFVLNVGSHFFRMSIGSKFIESQIETSNMDIYFVMENIELKNDICGVIIGAEEKRGALINSAFIEWNTKSLMAP